MSDGRRRPSIEVGDRLVIVENGVEVTVRELCATEIVAVEDDDGRPYGQREWRLEGWQVRYK